MKWINEIERERYYLEGIISFSLTDWTSSQLSSSTSSRDLKRYEAGRKVKEAATVASSYFK